MRDIANDMGDGRVCPRMGIKYLNPNMAILMGNMMINHGLFVGQNSSWDVEMSTLAPYWTFWEGQHLYKLISLGVTQRGNVDTSFQMA